MSEPAMETATTQLATAVTTSWIRTCPSAHVQAARVLTDWEPIENAPQDGTRLMLWDSVSKRPVFASWRGGNPKITHYAAEPTGPTGAESTVVTVVSRAEAEELSRRRVARMEGAE